MHASCPINSGVLQFRKHLSTTSGNAVTSPSKCLDKNGLVLATQRACEKTIRPTSSGKTDPGLSVAEKRRAFGEQIGQCLTSGNPLCEGQHGSKTHVMSRMVVVLRGLSPFPTCLGRCECKFKGCLVTNPNV